MGSTLTRRELLSRSSVLLLVIPVARGLAACSSSDTPAATTPGPNTCTGVPSTSTVTNAHQHTLCVATTDLTSPPAAGVTYTTSTDSGHNHTVSLTQAQLQSISSGGSVTVTSSSPASHDFTIKKA